MNPKPKCHTKRNRKYRDECAHWMRTPLANQQAA
jgi:hypothetical protein